MLLDWMHNSTLGDFEARIWTGRLLARCLKMFEQEEYSRTASLSTRILSVLAHFEQFIEPVRKRYAELYQPIELELRNFTKVVRYTDLNLWSVRESSKRAHAQLFRILRKFKVSLKI